MPATFVELEGNEINDAFEPKLSLFRLEERQLTAMEASRFDQPGNDGAACIEELAKDAFPGGRWQADRSPQRESD